MLTPRQATILNIIVADYIATATPVPSEHIARRHRLGVSPATVRNEMAALEGEGYITRPHSSAGGVPSDKGYRFFVESLAEVPELPVEVRVAIRRRLSRAVDLEWWVRAAAEVLAGLVHNLSLVTFPSALRARLRRLELVLLQDLLALLVVILHSARVRQRFVHLQEPATQEDLTRTANRLNALFGGLDRQGIAERAVELTPMEEQVVDHLLGVLEEEDRALYTDFYLEGLAHLLRQPEFAGPDRACRVVELVEGREPLQEVLASAPEGEQVRVVIGTEHREEALRPFSVVLARYGVPGEAVGVVGVLGPTRMEYPRAIAGVRYLSAVLNEMMAAVRGSG